MARWLIIPALVVALMPSITLAQGVLLPSNKSLKDGQPTLPVAPTPPVNSSNTSAKAPFDSKTFSQPNVSITPGGALSPAASGAAGFTPPSEVEIKTLLSQSGIPENAEQVTPEQTQRLQALMYQRYATANGTSAAPQIIDEPSPPELPAIYLQSLPNSINVAVSPRYVWGQRDIMAVQTALGYRPEQIPSNCQLRQDVNLASKNSINAQRLFSGQQANLKYNLAIERFSLMPKAICNPPAQLPNNGGLAMRSGKFLVVNLPSISGCPVPPANAKAVEIQYQGDGQNNCVYR